MEEVAVRAVIVDALAGLDALRQRFVDVLAAIDGHVEGVQVPGQGHWTEAKVEALWVGVRHLEGARALFEATAEHPNEAVPFERIRARSGLSDKHQRNHHARISRVAADLFGEPRWPIQNWQSTPGPDGKAVMHYRMGSTVAEWWRNVAAGPADAEPAR